MTTLNALSAGLEIYAAVVLTVVLYACLSDTNSTSKLDKYIIFMVESAMLMLITDAPTYFMEGVEGAEFFLHGMYFLSYVGCQASTVFFTCYIAGYMRKKAAVDKWLVKLTVANSSFACILWFISIFNGMIYYIDENVIMQSGPLFWLSQILGIVNVIIDCVYALSKHKILGLRQAILILVYSAIPMIATPFAISWETTPIYLAETITILLIFLMMHQEENLKSAEQGRELMKQRAQLANSRAKIMMSQIQPHFLYNTLNAIYYLIEKDPPMAQKAVNDFSEYLRMNIDTLSISEPIEFEKELKHIETYLWIEKMRFEDELEIVYEIHTKDFLIPALSVQPFVENAVKHGICKRECGGTLWLRTFKGVRKTIIEIEDNGVGFDTTKPKENDGRLHVGVENSRQRISTVMGGTIDVVSKVGIGTKVTITLPDEEEGGIPGKVIICK